jgi:DNA invertase Pin-like site-specific DNA recombinase
MRVKYNRVSTLNQSGNRFCVDTEKYDLILLDRVSGTIPFNDRPEAKKLLKLLSEGKLTEIVIEEWSRIGRNTGDILNTLQLFEDNGIVVSVRNLGIKSIVDGKKNPIWNLLSAVLSSIYQMELENIRERTQVGRMVYVSKGGVLGRPKGTSENLKRFFEKPKNKEIYRLLNKGLSFREISKIVGCSLGTIHKVKKGGIISHPS